MINCGWKFLPTRDDIKKEKNKIEAKMKANREAALIDRSSINKMLLEQR